MLSPEFIGKVNRISKFLYREYKKIQEVDPDRLCEFDIKNSDNEDEVAKKVHLELWIYSILIAVSKKRISWSEARIISQLLGWGNSKFENSGLMMSPKGIKEVCEEIFSEEGLFSVLEMKVALESVKMAICSDELAEETRSRCWSLAGQILDIYEETGDMIIAAGEGSRGDAQTKQDEYLEDIRSDLEERFTLRQVPYEAVCMEMIDEDDESKEYAIKDNIDNIKEIDGNTDTENRIKKTSIPAPKKR